PQGFRRYRHQHCPTHPSAATGADSPLLYIPDRSKQHARRLPEASISQVVAMRRARVSGFLAEVIQKIQSRRATGVRPCHGARALLRPTGTLGSGSCATAASSTVTASPPAAPAASRRLRGPCSQWLPCPSGSNVAWKGWPLSVPPTLTSPRAGSRALASGGTS